MRGREGREREEKEEAEKANAFRKKRIEEKRERLTSTPSGFVWRLQ